MAASERCGSGAPLAAPSSSAAATACGISPCHSASASRPSASQRTAHIGPADHATHGQRSGLCQAGPPGGGRRVRARRPEPVGAGERGADRVIGGDSCAASERREDAAGQIEVRQLRVGLDGAGDAEVGQERQRERQPGEPGVACSRRRPGRGLGRTGRRRRRPGRGLRVALRRSEPVRPAAGGQAPPRAVSGWGASGCGVSRLRVGCGRLRRSSLGCRVAFSRRKGVRDGFMGRRRRGVRLSRRWFALGQKRRQALCTDDKLRIEQPRGRINGQGQRGQPCAARHPVRPMPGPSAPESRSRPA